MAFSLLDTPAELRREPAFLLYTTDFSRIQRFIYTVHTEGALRSLRSRSFFLELLMEHYMDELLDGCGLTRTNIIYSGGGHCYLLLPNTATVQQTLADWNRAFNGWLNEQFGMQLFLANGWTPCSANDLCNVPAEASPYKALFRRVNAIAEQHKQHPYDAAALRALNRVQAIPDGTRECKVCGNSAQVNAEGLCPWCNRFANLSAQIQNQSIYLVHSTPRPGAFALPGIRGSKRFLSFSNDSGLCADAVRSYTKNRLVRTLSPSINLFVGDYAASNNIEDLADQSEGIRRVAICRMDVDNLGQAFIAGFEQPDQADPVQRMKYVNLFRAAAFSRQMSLFFKYHINGLLQGLLLRRFASPLIFKSRCEDEKRPVHKVYWSFLVGAAGFEPTASSSRTRRATNCAMPRKYRSRLGCGLVGDERIELPQVESESTALPLCKSPLFGLSGAARRC